MCVHCRSMHEKMIYNQTNNRILTFVNLFSLSFSGKNRLDNRDIQYHYKSFYMLKISFTQMRCCIEKIMSTTYNTSKVLSDLDKRLVFRARDDTLKNVKYTEIVVASM